MLLVSGCASTPIARSISCEAAPLKAISVDPQGGEHSILFDVLTFNVEGLPWPARSGRKPSLKAIGDYLNALRASGEAPDAILFQEAFSRPATKMVSATGYPTIVPGPEVHDSADRIADSPRKGRKRPGARVWGKGEIGLKFIGSGLAIASEYPVIFASSTPFKRKSCAGIDCLSNKGVLLARFAIPGLPAPLELITTHMNSQRASKVRKKRYNAVHLAQTDEIIAFIGANREDGAPMVLGGDFNMRQDEIRFDHFDNKVGMTLVHRYCGDLPNKCDVRMSWDGDAPWMDTQDLQLFRAGDKVSIAPVRVESWFDGPERGGKLSDHDAYRVTYKLSWRATPQTAQSTASLCPRRPISAGSYPVHPAL